MGLVAVSYQYLHFSQTAQSTAHLEGTWSGGFGAGLFGQMDLNIDTSGNITSGGDQAPIDCILAGTFIPADTAVNVYNALITSDGGTPINCTMSAGGYSGLAWTEGNGNNTMVLIVSNDTDARAVILTRN